MAEGQLRLLVIGAHPDDADYHGGGTAALYRAAGHIVKLVSLTNGDAGHQRQSGPELAGRRKREADRAAQVIGASYDIGAIHDGELLPTLDNRRNIIRLIRSFQPDLVLTHRPNDYHPDHRYTSQLVQDAAYMVTVPAIVPDVPHLPRDPVIAYLPDNFQKPYPFQPAVAVDVGPVLDTIVAMLDSHESQFYEWLPFNSKFMDQVPEDRTKRRQWLARFVEARLRQQADRFRELLIRQYGQTHGQAIAFAEGFEACEYGSPLDEAARRRLFPFAFPPSP